MEGPSESSDPHLTEHMFGVLSVARGGPPRCRRDQGSGSSSTLWPKLPGDCYGPGPVILQGKDLDLALMGSFLLLEVCLFICPSICPSAYSSIHPPAHIPTFLSIHPSFIHPSIHHLSSTPPFTIYQSSIHPSMHPCFVRLSYLSWAHRRVSGGPALISQGSIASAACWGQPVSHHEH